MATMQIGEKLQPWLAAIERRPDSGPRWLQDLRTRGAATFAALGFPTVRDEEWRFTNVAPIASSEFRLAPPAALPVEALDGFLYANASHRLVIVNGRLVPELSRTSGLPAGLTFGSLAGALRDRPDMAAHLGTLADVDGRPFGALNTAFIEDGAFVSIPDGVALAEPLQLLFVCVGEDAVMTHPRTVVITGARSQACLVETYVGTGAHAYFTNAVTEIFAGEGSFLDHYKVQEETLQAFHVASMHLRAARGATVSSHSFVLGGRFVRNDVMALLDGEGAEVTLNGLYLADGDRLVDNHTTIDHAKAHCPSHEVYKGILGGRARAVFNGKIIVRQDAQKTDAKQTNRALLLNEGATINTKPQLEIFADDVKCTHGAAIGQLDEDALFYLQARGLTFAEARDLLIHAFAGEILDRVRIEPLKAVLERELYAQLARDLAEIDAV